MKNLSQKIIIVILFSLLMNSKTNAQGGAANNTWSVGTE